MVYPKAMRLSGGKTGHAELGYNLRYAGLMNESMDLYQISSKLDESGTGRANFLIQSGKSNIYLGEID